MMGIMNSAKDVMKARLDVIKEIDEIIENLFLIYSGMPIRSGEDTGKAMGGEIDVGSMGQGAVMDQIVVSLSEIYASLE